MIADAFASMLDWRPRNASFENPAFSIADAKSWESVLGGVESESGIKVTHATALTLGAVWQAVSTISGDVAVSTLNVFKVLDDDDREIDWSHEAQSLIAVQPNEETSAFEFWRRLMVHACLWQNGYAFIMREGGASKGRMIGLYNLLPDRTCPMRDEYGTLYYVSEVNGKLEAFRANEILHVKGLSLDGSKGLDLIEKARDCWGLALAAQGFGAKFFKNGAQAGGTLEIPATFTEKAKQVLEEGFDKKYSGKDNWFKTVVLRDGAKFHANTIDAQKSQMHELRDDQVRDTARFFNMPPSKVGLSDSVSYNSLEQSQIAYLTGCLNHWFGSIRGECNIKLLRANERTSGKWYFEHNVTKLLEVDTATMNNVLAIQRQNEVINADEWRRKIGLNKRPDGKGNEYANPNTKSNTPQPATQEPEKKAKPTPSETDVSYLPRKLPLRHLFCDNVNRVTRRICADAASEAKNIRKFEAWVDGDAVLQRKWFADVVRPILAVMTDDIESHFVTIDQLYFRDILGRLSPLLKPPFSANDLVVNVESVCADFEKTIADRLCESLKGIV